MYAMIDFVFQICSLKNEEFNLIKLKKGGSKDG